MFNKKIFRLVLIFFIICACIGIIIFFILKPNNNEEGDGIINEEYTPREEITGEQLRQTIVTLYFNQKETNTLMPEARLIDSKILIENPYVSLVNLLIQGPKNERLESCMPEGANLISAELKDDVVYLNFSSEFILNHVGGEEKEKQTIDAIVNTLTELNEVNAVRIIIDGEENLSFQDNIINFKDNFIRNY